MQGLFVQLLHILPSLRTSHKKNSRACQPGLKSGKALRIVTSTALINSERSRETRIRHKGRILTRLKPVRPNIVDMMVIFVASQVAFGACRPVARRADNVWSSRVSSNRLQTTVCSPTARVPGELEGQIGAGLLSLQSQVNEIRDS